MALHMPQWRAPGPGSDPILKLLCRYSSYLRVGAGTQTSLCRPMSRMGES